jgi:hypothetical protein
MGRMSHRDPVGLFGRTSRGAVGLLWLGGLFLLALTFRPVVEGDGVNYFSYLHSLVIDRDLDFSDEYRAALEAGLPVYSTLVETRTPTGLVANFQPAGAALLAMPAYLAALALRPGGSPQYATEFVIAYTAASLLCGLLALGLCFRLAREVLEARQAAVVGTLVAAGATPFLYYLLWEPSYAHTFSAAVASAFVLLWWRGRGRLSAAGWLGLGLLAGLAATVRYQDGLLAAIVLLDLGRARWRLLAFALGALGGFLPQMLVTHAVFGTWLPYRPPEFAPQLWPGHYLDVLFSSHNGLLIWTPAALAAAAGYRFVGDRRLTLAAALALGLELLIEGSAPDWWGGHAFGMRRLLVLLPFAAVGLSAVAVRLVRRPRLLVAAAGLLVAWNLVLVANFEYVIRADRDVGYLGLLNGQVSALSSLPRLFSQGGAVRWLVLWAPLHRPFQPLAGSVLLALEGLGLAIALWLAGGRPVAGWPRAGVAQPGIRNITP